MSSLYKLHSLSLVYSLVGTAKFLGSSEFSRKYDQNSLLKFLNLIKAQVLVKSEFNEAVF